MKMFNDHFKVLRRDLGVWSDGTKVRFITAIDSNLIIPKQHVKEMVEKAIKWGWKPPKHYRYDRTLVISFGHFSVREEWDLIAEKGSMVYAYSGSTVHALDGSSIQSNRGCRVHLYPGAKLNYSGGLITSEDVC